MLAYWKIRSRLLGVPGVANVAIWGEQLKMLQVQVDPERLAKLRPDPRPGHGDDVGRAGRGLAALFRRRPYRHRRLHRHRRTSALPSIISWSARPRKRWLRCRSPSATESSSLLGDVAKLDMGPQGMVGDAVINDGPGLMLIIEKYPLGQHAGGDPGRGSRAGGDEARPAGRRDRHQDLPPRRAIIAASIDNLSHALLLGCILVVVVVLSPSCTNGAPR